MLGACNQGIEELLKLSLAELEGKVYEIKSKIEYIKECGLSSKVTFEAIGELERELCVVREVMHAEVDNIFQFSVEGEKNEDLIDSEFSKVVEGLVNCLVIDFR